MIIELQRSLSGHEKIVLTCQARTGECSTASYFILEAEYANFQVVPHLKSRQLFILSDNELGKVRRRQNELVEELVLIETTII